MEFVVAASIAVVVSIVAILLRRRRVTDAPTQKTWTVPTQLDPIELGIGDAEWMIAVFTPNGRCTGTDGRASRPVGSLPLGQTWGLFDLTGNTLEWVADRYVPYGEGCPGRSGADPLCDRDDAPERSLRGGSAQTPAATPARLRTAARARQTPERQDNTHGFRCAR